MLVPGLVNPCVQGGSGSGTTNQYAAQLRGTDGFELIRRVATGSSLQMLVSGASLVVQLVTLSLGCTGYTRADAEITVLCQGLVADYFGGELHLKIGFLIGVGVGTLNRLLRPCSGEDLAYPPGEEPEEEDLDVVMGLMNQLELQQGDQQGQEQGDQGQGDDDAQGDDQVDAEAS